MSAGGLAPIAATKARNGADTGMRYVEETEDNGFQRIEDWVVMQIQDVVRLLGGRRDVFDAGQKVTIFRHLKTERSVNHVTRHHFLFLNLGSLPRIRLSALFNGLNCLEQRQSARSTRYSLQSQDH